MGFQKMGSWEKGMTKMGNGSEKGKWVRTDDMRRN